MTTTWNPDFKPEAALKFFRRKGLKTSFAWQDMWQEEHDTAFTIAKMMDLDLLRDMKESVDKAIANGSTFEKFRQQVQPELMKRGWWGRADMPDPATGEMKDVQLGSVRRLETIFRVNMQNAYSAGDWENITDSADTAPYLMYDAVDDNRTREQHKAWDGTVLRWDDPWWQSHRPPNGWNCRCSTIQLSASDVEAMGLKVDTVPPPVFTRDYTNPRTKVISKLPLGIDPGFAHNAGAASLRAHALQVFGEKVAQVPAMMGALAWQSLMTEKPSLMRALDDAWVQFVDKVSAAETPRREWFVVGALHPEDVAYLKGRGIEPITAEVAGRNRTVKGTKQTRYEGKGKALTLDEIRKIPDVVRAPEAVLFDTKNKTLLYVGASSDRKQKITVQPNLEISGPKRTLNSIDSSFKVPLKNLIEQPTYVLVRGVLK